MLHRLRTELDALYGDRIERVILYGSRARGDAHQDSDYDIAVFLTDISDHWAEQRRLSAITSALFDETGYSIHPLIFRAGAWRERNPLMHDIRQDGIDIGKSRPRPHSSDPRHDEMDGSGMSPEAAFFLEKARKLLAQARGNLGMEFFEQAGRLGYTAALNAAQALIFERSQRVVKPHDGVKSRFNFLTKEDPRVDGALRKFLEDGYDLKVYADYPSPSDPVVTPEMATGAVDTATRFVETVAALLEPSAAA